MMKPFVAYYSKKIRIITVGVLFLFVFSTLLGFSSFIDVRPAKAIFVPVMDEFVVAALQGETLKQQAFSKLRDFLKAVAQDTLLRFVANAGLKLVQELEQNFIIKNILLYSDALAADQYIGDSLKGVLPGLAQGNNASSTPKTSLSDLIKNANLNSFAGLSGGQIAQLALRAGGAGGAKVTIATPVPNQADGSVSQVSTATLSGTSGTFGVTVNGTQITTPFNSSLSQTATNLAGAIKANSAINLDVDASASGAVVTVTAVLAGIPFTITNGGTSGGGGLNFDQENALLGGAIASLTSLASCGGTNRKAQENLGTYIATRTLGFDSTRIDPRNPVDFYEKISRLGNPFATPEFNQLALEDAARSVESKAQQAVSQELQSPGFKSERADTGNITRTGRTFVGFIEQFAGNSLGTLNFNASGSYVSRVGSFASQFIADTITKLIFDTGGKVLSDDKYECGVLGNIADVINIPTFGNPDRPDNPDDQTANAFIKANAQEGFVEVTPGPVAITWFVGGNVTQAYLEINGQNRQPVNNSGSRSEEISGRTTFKLIIDSPSQGSGAEVARVTVDIAAEVPDVPGTPPAKTIVFSADPLEINQGESTTLAWNVSAGYAASFGITCKIRIRSYEIGASESQGTTIQDNIDCGNGHDSVSGTLPQTPDVSMEYRLEVLDGNEPDDWTERVRVTVATP